MSSRSPDRPALAAQVERMLRDGPLLRVVNFHQTPASRAEALDRPLALLARHFAPVDEERLDAYCETGTWRGRPGIVLAFYNGYRSNFDVARPLLDRHGLVGWFFVVSGFTSTPPAEQRAFAARHDIPTPDLPDDQHPRIALSWDEVRALDERHVIASHTRGHVDIARNDEALLRVEVVGSQDDLAAALGHPVTAFAAHRGGAYGENPLADRLIDEAGYRFLFSNLKIQRIGR